MAKASRRVWSHDDLLMLNTVCTPIWVFSCATNKLVWANKAACGCYGMSLDRLLATRLSRGSGEEVRQRVQKEIEIGGGEMTLSGAAGPLPGVLPYPEAASSDFFYQQLMIGQPETGTTLCTLVQVRNAMARPMPNSHTTLAKMIPRAGSGQLSSSLSLDGKLTKQGLASLPAISMPAILDLVEDILAGRAVSTDLVESLHQMLVRGELLVQGSRISEELLVKEELDQDVGLNLLQLLGNSPLRGTPELLDGLLDRERQGNGNSMSDLGAISRRYKSCSNSSRHASQGDDGISGGGNSQQDEEDTSSVVASLFPAMEAVLATVDDWRFDSFKLSEATAGHPMSALGFWFIRRAGLLDSLQLDGQALARFLRKVEDSYPDNCYHNKTHAADVLQSMHVLMTRGGLLRRLGDDAPLLMLAGYLASIIHDNEHRGLNNDFLVRTSDDLALTYNDTSPMENHHVAAAFRVMRCPGYNFIRRLSRERLARLRRLLIEMVLATDMKQHFNILSKFQAKLQVKLRTSSYQTSTHSSGHDVSGSSRRSEEDVLVEDEADKSLVLQVALKCADVGHLAAPWDVHHRWVSGLEEEFFRQGDKEKAAHLAVSPLMDRCRDGITKSQVGFFDIVALPLFYSWAAVFHEALPLVRAVEDNCNRWRLLEAGRNSHVSK